MKAKTTDNKKPKSQLHKLAAYGGKFMIFWVTFALLSIIFGKIAPSPEIPVVTHRSLILKSVFEIAYELIGVAGFKEKS